MQLRPCTACNRHVALEATSCPFCGAALAVAPPIQEPRARLSRAAVFAAATALTATAACWTSKTEPKHVEQQTIATTPDASSGSHVEAAPPDAAVVVTAPSPDAAIVQRQKPPPPPVDPFDPDQGRRVQHHPCTMTPKGPICAPYGAPPARRRIV